MKINTKVVKYLLLSILTIALGLILFQFIFQERDPEALAYQRNCSACHLLPDPKDLPKAIWEERILPEMGARLGIKVGDYNPFKRLDMEESYYLKYTGTYPESPGVSPETWENLKNYLLKHAPDSLDFSKRKSLKPLTLKQFKASTQASDEHPGAFVTCLNYQTSSHSLWVGNVYGELYTWKNMQERSLKSRFTSPIVNTIQEGEREYITEIGIMHPTDNSTGKFWLKDSEKSAQVIEQLKRPVYAVRVDLNDDKKDEFVIAEFGNNRGQLSMLTWDKAGKKYLKSDLLQVPGIIKIVAEDMNGDRKKDLVFLASQGNEALYILYNRGNLEFSLRTLLRFSPVFGSSWFELFDYDLDGDLDIALVNGDNADYSVTLKPYHGLRIYLNDGNNRFKEAFFYPIFGSTRVIARDFDQDNDMDFAITSFFPDWERTPEQSFIYLENKNSKRFEFQPYTFKQATEGRWMVMESGDFDRDGDLDLVLGSCLKSQAPKAFTEKWRTQNVDLIFLENLLKSPPKKRIQ